MKIPFRKKEQPDTHNWGCFYIDPDDPQAGIDTISECVISLMNEDDHFQVVLRRVVLTPENSPPLLLTRLAQDGVNAVPA